MILASNPNDEEKSAYLKTNINFLVTYQVFSLILMFTGMILFIYSYPFFYIYIPYALFLAFYFGISFYTNAFGNDFDYQTHLKLKNTPMPFYPSVDIFLPCCGESYELLDNTYSYVSKISYSNYVVHILDDSADPLVKQMAIKYGFNYLVRPDRPHLKKAGNLRYAFRQTNGDYYLVLDADFCPRPEIIQELIIYMVHDSKIGIVQSPQYFRVNKLQNWVERGAGLVQELFYRIIQVHRDRFGASICVGTSALYKREALMSFGGSASIEHSEDLHTGFNVILAGYKVKYISVILSTGICPDSLNAFFTQQYRWATGSTSLLLNSDFWKSKLTVNQKLCYMSGMMYYFVNSVNELISPTYSILLLYIRPQFIFWYNLVFIIPTLFFYTVVYPLWSRYEYNVTFDILRIQIVQSYAHLFAIFDKLTGRTVGWVATNNVTSKKNNNFLFARILLMSYTILTASALIGGSIYRSYQYPWYNFIPSILLMAYHFFLNFNFMINQN